MRTRFVPSAIFYLGIAFLCIGLVAIPTACTKNHRQDTLRASLVTVNGARDVFLTWDRDHQLQIVKDATTRTDAEAKLKEYQDKQANVHLGFEIAYHALATAATQSDDPSLQRALAEVAKIVMSLRELGVPKI